MNLADKSIRRGLDDFTLKVTALLLMTMDHIHQFFSSNGVPIWFTWLGRLSAPLFFFTMAEGFYHTRNKITYVKRLYILSVIMSLGKYIAWKVSIIDRTYPMVPNNIFETFFLIAFNILILEFIRDKNKEQFKKAIISFLILLFEVILPLSIYTFIPKNISKIILSFLPCPLLCEGGIIFVILGIAFFYLRENRKVMISFYLVFSLLFLPYYNLSIENAFYHDYQWMMIFSVPFMMLYNGQKGHGLKYLFYTYYPVHIFLFFFIAGIIN